jgi:hypothetical protein
VRFKNSSVKRFKILISQTYRRRNPAYFETEDAMIIRYIVLQHVNAIKWKISLHGLYMRKMDLLYIE